MLRYILLVVGMLFFTFFHVSAQKTDFKVKCPAEVQPILSNGFYINKVTVAPTLGKIVGSAQVGIKNRRVDAILEEDPKISFLRMSSQFVPATRGATPLTLNVTLIRVDEVTTLSNETGTANVSAQLIYKNDDNKNIVVYEGSGDAMRKSISDVSSKLGLLTSEAFRDLLKDFSASDWKSNLNSGVPTAELADASAPNPNPAYEAPIKEGVYITAADFLKRTPSERSYKIDESVYYKLKFTDKKKAVPVFAVFHKDNLYLSGAMVSGGQANKKLLLKTRYDGPFYYCEHEMSDPVAMIAFGMIGGALSMKRYGVVLDIRTGNISVLNEQILTDLTKDDLDLRKYIAENRKMNPIGSRKIIEELNKRVID